jgi:hypothetical protein
MARSMSILAKDDCALILRASGRVKALFAEGLEGVEEMPTHALLTAALLMRVNDDAWVSEQINWLASKGIAG